MALFYFLCLIDLMTYGTLIEVHGRACDRAMCLGALTGEGRALISVAVKCFGELFLMAVALTRSSSICSTRCWFLKLNLVEWQKIIVIISPKL